MTLEWKPTGPSSNISRSAKQATELLRELATRPGEWAVYSRHVSVGAARARRHDLPRSARFAGLPMEWAVSREAPDRTAVLVRWVGAEGIEPPVIQA